MAESGRGNAGSQRRKSAFGAYGLAQIDAARNGQDAALRGMEEGGCRTFAASGLIEVLLPAETGEGGSCRRAGEFEKEGGDAICSDRSYKLKYRGGDLPLVFWLGMHTMSRFASSLSSCLS